MPVTAVGFDLDDTLCVPARDRATLLDEAVESVDGRPAPTWASRSAYRRAHRANLTGETRTPVFESMLEDAAVDADATDLARAYRERVNASLRPVDGAEALVRGLRERYRVGLLTNGPSVAQRTKLDALGWTDAFDATLVSGELPAGKPDGRAFRALLDALDASPAELVYVGDDPEADVGGASAAGCRVVQVVGPGGPDPDPRAAAQVPLDALADELPRTLAGLESGA